MSVWEGCFSLGGEGRLKKMQRECRSDKYAGDQAAAVSLFGISHVLRAD